VFAQRRFDFAALLPFLIHPFDPIGSPTHAAFEKRDPQFGKFLGNPGIHQAGKLNERLDGSANGVHENKTVETFVTRGTLAPIVHAERDIQSLHLFIEGPETPRSQMLFHALGRHRDRTQAKLGYRPIRLGDRCLGVLQSDQTHRL
jgi:hypothetical protein